MSQSKAWSNGCVLTIGNFDGVHRGHRSLIDTLVQMAHQLEVPSVVFTFDPPPLKLLRPDFAPKPLTWNQRRESLLKSLGVDCVHFFPTTPELLNYTPREFFKGVLVEQLQVRGMVEGPNFRFGKDRVGDIESLGILCEEFDVSLKVAESQHIGERLVSSTQIRRWIEQGDMRSANECLVEAYRIAGTVGHGAARGRTLGFPTANIEGIEVLIPKHGVYSARVVAPNALASIPVALHIGPNPTFAEDANKVEAHLLDYQGDLYGSYLEIEILDLVRDVQKFQSKEALLGQLHQDIERVRTLVGRNPPPTISIEPA